MTRNALFPTSTRLIVIALLVNLLLTFGAALGHAKTDSCPDAALPPRLTAGEYARVLFDHTINLRSTPSTTISRIGEVATGTLLYVTAESQCAEGYRWWPINVMVDGVETQNPIAGWLVEGDPTISEYWLEPRGHIEAITDEMTGETREYVVDENGDIVELAGCMTPPDDYTRIIWGAAQETFNIRTVAMLMQADRLYKALGGTLDLEFQIVQGSYNEGVVEASFGTHDGGGAVDISVRSPIDFSLMSDDIPPLLEALRTAGFAAWLRDQDELYPGSPIHIHAIAVGDEELSEAARRQIDGLEGYLRGFNGLPQPEGVPPVADISGDPIICQWMVEAGFDNLRETEE